MRTVYLQRLNESRSGAGPVRFAAYVMTADGLEAIWPDLPYSPAQTDAHREKCAKEAARLFGMVYSRADKYPAFHYSRSGCGYSKEQCIAEDISRLVYPGEAVTVYTLGGYSPSRVGTFRDGKYAGRVNGGAA